jgi:hypothetical protein
MRSGERAAAAQLCAWGWTADKALAAKPVISAGAKWVKPIVCHIIAYKNHFKFEENPFIRSWVMQSW